VHEFNECIGWAFTVAESNFSLVDAILMHNSKLIKYCQIWTLQPLVPKIQDEPEVIQACQGEMCACPTLDVVEGKEGVDVANTFLAVHIVTKALDTAIRCRG
jgi:hypothetical protein